MTQFHHEFRARSLWGVGVWAAAALALNATAMIGTHDKFWFVAGSFFAIVTLGLGYGLLTDHRVGASLRSVSFEWWSSGGLFAFTRSLSLKEIQSAEYISTRRRTLLRLKLYSGRTISVPRFFFRDGDKLLHAFHANHPAITILRNGSIVFPTNEVCEFSNVQKTALVERSVNDEQSNSHERLIVRLPNLNESLPCDS